MAQQQWAGGVSNDAKTWPYSVAIYIAHKTTPERGTAGQGLLDNLQGECGKPVVNPTHPDPTHPTRVERVIKDPSTGAVLSYAMYVLLQPSAGVACVNRAIRKAENQDITCSTRFDGHNAAA